VQLIFFLEKNSIFHVLILFIKVSVISDLHLIISKNLFSYSRKNRWNASTFELAIFLPANPFPPLLKELNVCEQEHESYSNKLSTYFTFNTKNFKTQCHRRRLTLILYIQITQNIIFSFQCICTKYIISI